MPLRSLKEIMSIKPFYKKNLVIRRKSWRNQQPLKGDSPYQPHHPLTHRSCIAGRTSKFEDFKILTIFMNQLKINFHYHQIITFYICIHMYMGLSTHSWYQFYNSTEIKKKLSTKSSSYLIFRDSTDFMGWSVGRGPEIAKS